MDGKSDRDKLRDIYKVSNKEADEIARWQRFFYSFEFIDIQKLLFAKGWINEDEKAKASFLEKNQDLSQLTDEELRMAFCKYTPQSDWERFFSRSLDLMPKKLLRKYAKAAIILHIANSSIEQSTNLAVAQYVI